MRPHTFLAVAFLLLGVCVSFAGAQAGGIPSPAQQSQAASDPRNFDATQYGERVTLGPDWLFEPGDNPAYASPTFDDSGWKTISTQKELLEYGIHDIRHGWYRIHIHLGSSARNLTVAIEQINGSYELYANGQRIGANGSMQGLAYFTQNRLFAFPVPESLVSSRGDLVLAIRFAINPSGSQGAGTSTPIPSASGIYLLSADAATRDISYTLAHRAGYYLILGAFSILIALVALALYLTLRDQKEYLAAAAYLLLTGFLFFIDAWVYFASRTPLHSFIQYAFYGASNYAYIEFIRLVLRMRRTRWLLALEIAAVVCAFASPLAGYRISHFYYFGFAAFFTPILIVGIVLITLLITGWRAGNFEARILLPAVLFESFYRYWSFFYFLIYYFGLTRTLNALPTFHAGSYDIPLGGVSDFIFRIAILIFLVLRTVGIARRHALLAAELEAARTVQQVLIPEDIPNVPGFLLQSVYKPAGQVGGDFFQILPVRGGGVLAVIGDVSGKGMPAAMTVSLLVGTVRTLAHYTQSPGEILAAMNQRMMARSGGGFTTCLVLRADTNGTLTVANAGHISPYLAGKELALNNGLPLGLAADATYSESTFQLPQGEQLTLLSDGVVEARSDKGELLGFDRLAKLSLNSAAEIADTAKAFGQDDDITVLTLARTA
jgi:sigma-B regulation protein RsbU (phosphoserine phosphatase)